MVKGIRAVVAAGLAGVLAGGCQSRKDYQAHHVNEKPEMAASAPATKPAEALSTIKAEDLRDLLADMEKAHEDKIRLSGWAGTPFLPVKGDFKPFFSEMSRQNKELSGELKKWAKEHQVDLTYKYSDDVDGRALRMMEDRQEKIIRGDDQANFERDILIEMFSDYEWHLCVVKSLLPAVKDRGLRDYLEKSEAMFERGSAEIRGLLKRYKFQ